MLSLDQLKQMLKDNEFYMIQALNDKNSKRQLELLNHRALIKDLIITELERELINYKKVG